MPFAGMINNEIADLQKEIELLKHKNKKNMNEINHHNYYNDYLMCHHRVMGDHESAFPPYGMFAWRNMAYYVVTYFCHLIVYRYLDTEIDIFLKSINDTIFLEYTDVINVYWTFEYCFSTGILKVKKVE